MDICNYLYAQFFPCPVCDHGIRLDLTGDWRVSCPLCGAVHPLEEIVPPCVVDAEGFVSCDGWVIAYKGDATALIVSGDYKALGPYALAGAKIHSLVVEEGVESIDYRACFACLSLTSVTLPDSVMEMSSEVFASCQALRKVKLPNILYELRGTFKDCVSLEAIRFPERLEAIEQEAFKDARVNSDDFAIPPVRRIGRSAFEKFEKAGGGAVLSVPHGVEIIGERAFYGNHMKHVFLPETLKLIDAEAFAGCNKLEWISIPESVEHVGPRAFAECTNLSEVEIPESTL